MIQYDKIKEIINNNSSFLITTHVNPDADAIGSEMAFYYLLQKLGKEARIINHNATPENISILDPGNIIQKFNPELHKNVFNDSDVHVFLDLNHLDRTISLEPFFRANPKTRLCIDHHDLPEDFTQYMFADISYASTGEIIFEIIESCDVELDYNIALALYAAIMTDTGSFKYDRTSPETHHKAAKLLAAGVNPKTVYREILELGGIGRLRLLGRALDSIKLFHSGQLGTMIIRRKDLEETGTSEADMEGFVNYTLSVRGVRIGLFFYELSNGFKVSFRSVDDVPVNVFAREFNGGGHFHAAGARIYEKKLDDYFNTIVEAAEKYLN